MQGISRTNYRLAALVVHRPTRNSSSTILINSKACDQHFFFLSDTVYPNSQPQSLNSTLLQGSHETIYPSAEQCAYTGRTADVLNQ
jgi:hypothetical protein